MKFTSFHMSLISLNPVEIACSTQQVVVFPSICGTMDNIHCGRISTEDVYKYDLDNGLHMLPKLSADHILLNSYSVMRVKLAVQVLVTVWQ